MRVSRERLHTLENQFPCASWLPVICQNPASVTPTWQELCAQTELNDNARSRPGKILLTGRRLRVLLLASVVITILLMGSRWQGKLQTWELQAFDQLMQLRPVAVADRRLLVVRVTAADIKAQPPEERGGGAASLSDRTLDKLLKILESHQPQVIGLDIYREGSVSPVYADLKASLRGNDRLISICEGSSSNVNDSGISAPSEVPPHRIGFSDFVLDEDDVVRRHLFNWLRVLDNVAVKYCTKSHL